jgi:tryptophan synthase alpha chain
MLEALFERAKGAGRAAFIPYVMAGDPDVATSEAVLLALTDAGADAIELGIPYGDPLADGPTIAAAAQRALAHGVGMSDVFGIVKRHKENGGAPVVLFSYYNPVYQYGVERFAHDAAEAGASAAIVPDIPLEEGAELSATLAEHGLDMPLLVAPSTTPARAARIAQKSTGFVYVVARLGVTGAGRALASGALRDQIAALRGQTDHPLAVGFGVSEPEHARELASIADGIIVGSALIDAFAGTRGNEAVARVRTFVDPLIAASHFGAA